MRRVVTGDDIAQVRNPDPFAVPAWRSPVYRTPLWIVAIVHLVRMIVWLVRFLFRHPVLVLAAVIGVLMWRVTGWLGLVVLEQINATSGLGYMMFQAQNYGRTDIILVGLLMYGVFGLASDTTVRFIERRVLSWRRTLSS